MNFPNLLTLSRIPLMLIVIGLLYPDPSTTWPGLRSLALFLFLFAALTDWLDGWLARKFGQVSEFGKFMDALADKVPHHGHVRKSLSPGCFGKMDSLPNPADSFQGIPYNWLTIGGSCQRKNFGGGESGQSKDGDPAIMHFSFSWPVIP
jgi:hypothetical protein